MTKKLIAYFMLAMSIMMTSIANADEIKQTDYQKQEILNNDKTWSYIDKNGDIKVNLYFIWSKTCPHCKAAHPFIDKLKEKYSWIDLKSYSVSDSGTYEILKDLADKTGKGVNSVPFIANCGTSFVGWSTAEVTGKYLENQLRACYIKLGGTFSKKLDNVQENYTKDVNVFETCDSKGEESCSLGNAENEASLNTTSVQPIDIPFVGEVAPEKMSLPMLTVVLAGVDAFNPCAFFVLLFLLSIMVNAKSRVRMLIVGGIFVFFSGLIYFFFMAAWLNMFALLGGSDGGYIILGAGILAVIAGFINVKDYFYTKGKVTLSMSAENRTSLIKRMGKLTNTSSMATMIGGTTVLAIMANAYELLCTAGFPMIYTSVLTMHNLPDFERYMYLLFYNVVYVIPLAVIVIVFSMTLGKRKLTEHEGQVLKLMSGTMMLGLGAMLVYDPTSLQNPVIAIGLILASIVLTFIINTIKKQFYKKK